MNDNGTDHPRTWRITKPAARGRNGVVVSQHVLASEAGTQVLREGGNAVDAAVTTALAMGVLEPWLSGIGGGGLLLTFNAQTGRVSGLDFGMMSPRNLDPARYPISPNKPLKGLFGWPRVLDDRNLEGFDSICVPGAVDGLGTALHKWGTISWGRALEPAIGYARDGLLVDWYTTLSIASASSDLQRFANARRVFMPDGAVPADFNERAPNRLPLGNLADTLEKLSVHGHRDFYEGELARRLVHDLRSGGSAIGLHDLRTYHSRETESTTVQLTGTTVHTMPGLTGGPTLVAILEDLERALPSATEPSPDDHVAIARAIQHAYAHRTTAMGHASEPDTCTTHVSAIDKDGNMAALTNTLLARFGSKVVLGDTGILMNNAMMWFDPHPATPNSIHPAAQPLANMCPTLIVDQEGPRAALGAAGGRRIAPALAQVIAYMNKYGMSPERASIYPRIDATGEHVTVDEDLPHVVIDRLAKEFDVEIVRRDVFPSRFSVPSVAALDHGDRIGVAYPEGPWPAAIAT